MRLAALFLFFSNSVIGEYVMFPESSNVRRAQIRPPRRRRAKKSCLVLISEKDYEDRRDEDQPLECVLQGADLNGTRYKKVRLRGLTSRWAQENRIASGQSTIFAPNAEIDDGASELIIPAGGTIELGNATDAATGFNPGIATRGMDPADLFWNRRLRTGTKRVLVLRAVASDRSTTASEAELSDDIFGTSGDVINLKTQYRSCSDNQLIFEPLTTNSLVGSDGVYTVSIPTTVVTGAADSGIVTAMVNKATADLGSLTTLVDYVMVCVPPGTSGGWIAYAYINYWLSVYNDNWCRYPSGQLHEIGHNLNLGHSGEGTLEYDDQSGMMGYSYSSDEGPIMCFNGAKTWQLGWYSAFHVDLPIGTSYAWSGNLVGFSQRASASATDKMIVRIRSSTIDVYVHYNAMVGFNSGTREGGNQVLVATRSPGTGYSASTLRAKLSANGIHTIANFAGTTSALTIEVVSIVTATTPARAFVRISLGPWTPTAAPVPTFLPTPRPTSSRPTPLPTTSRPTRFPTTSRPTPFPTTRRPTPFPTTRKPTSSPTTRKPTPVPTRRPTPIPTTRMPTPFPTTLTPTAFPTTLQPTSMPTTANPTGAPSTVSPTLNPTSSPTASPTSLQPTMAPTTSSPTASPTTSPTASPTSAPTESSPTASPTTSPTSSSPTASPTASPTLSPTASPTTAPTDSSPTASPTTSPTSSPTTSPTASPTTSPTTTPTLAPTLSPTTLELTPDPTASPTTSPTVSPTASPTAVEITLDPTTSPTIPPTTAG